MKSPLSIGCLLLGVALAVPATAGDLRSLLPKPDSLGGWVAPAPARVFVGDELFDLIDGGAELYREYGFTRALSWQLGSGSKATMQIEIYQMNDAPAAYGVFSLMPSAKGAPLELGQGAWMFDYYLVFWKGPYYVTITGSRPGDDVRAACLYLGQQIADNILQRGELPAWFEGLPKTGQRERKFFRGPIGLANIDMSGLGDLFAVKEGLCGSYDGVRLLVFQYPTIEFARSQLARVREQLLKSTSFRDVSLAPPGFTCVDATGNTIAGRQQGKRLVVFVYTDLQQYRDLESALNHVSVPPQPES